MIRLFVFEAILKNSDVHEKSGQERFPFASVYGLAVC